MNVQHAFVDALSIDYNIAFRGSICTPREKVESRRMLVATMRRWYRKDGSELAGESLDTLIQLVDRVVSSAAAGDKRVVIPVACAGQSWPMRSPRRRRAGEAATANVHT